MLPPLHGLDDEIAIANAGHTVHDQCVEAELLCNRLTVDAKRVASQRTTSQR